MDACLLSKQDSSTSIGIFFQSEELGRFSRKGDVVRFDERALWLLRCVTIVKIKDEPVAAIGNENFFARKFSPTEQMRHENSTFMRMLIKT